jgi:phosphatidylglycerol---prolipoprotein diacylglyceryl transferase
MIPTLGHLGRVPIDTHDVFVGFGVLVGALVFVAEVRRRRVSDERIWAVVAGALAGGALFSRLGTWVQHVDLRRNSSIVEQWAYGNRSILSGLLGAYLGALLFKRIVGYRTSTGDLFAPAVALGLAIGRIGCLLTELPGTPTNVAWGITLTPAEAARIPGAAAGVPLHPSFVYEIAFHLAAFAALWYLRGRLTAPGELFKLYVAGYGVFRFLVEFVRGNEVAVAGLTRPQLFLVAFLPLIAWHIVRQARRGAYRLSTPVEPVPASARS